MTRFLRIHDGLVVPEDGTVFDAPAKQPPGGGVYVYVRGHEKPWMVAGEVAQAVLAFASGALTFPERTVNGRVTVDLPEGWASAQKAREMRAGLANAVSSVPQVVDIGQAKMRAPQANTAVPFWQQLAAPPPAGILMPEVPRIDEEAVRKLLGAEGVLLE